jgi:sulfatase-like protein
MQSRLATGMLCVAVAAGSVSPAIAQTRQEKVVVVIIDGLRDTDGFGSSVTPPGGGQPASPDLPLVFQYLVPQGTWYPQTKVLGKTYTTPGCDSIVCGEYVGGSNRGTRTDNGTAVNRSLAPTLFELYRKAYPTEVPWLALDKGNATMANYSFFPALGQAFGAPILDEPAGAGDLIYTSDLRLFPNVISTLTTQQPRLCVVELGATDFAGHLGVFSSYLDTIRRADWFVFNLWSYIQSSPFYRDSTTMFITSDHGRHDDRNGTFASHGGQCRGCRSIATFVIGPHTPHGLTVNRSVSQIDVAPSAATLLGLPVSSMKGEVLSEAFGRAWNPRPAIQYDPDVYSIGSNVFFTYTEITNGQSNVMVAGSRDGGRTFPVLTQVNPPHAPDAFAPVARNSTVIADQNGIQVCFLSMSNPEGRVILQQSRASFIEFRNRGRLVFAPSELAAPSVIEGERPNDPLLDGNSATFETPRIASVANGTGEIVVTPVAPLGIIALRSDSGFVNGHEDFNHVVPPATSYHEKPAVATGPNGDIIAVWQNVGRPLDSEDGLQISWDILGAVSHDGGFHWQGPIAITDNLTPSLHPDVAIGFDGRAHVFWSDEDAAGVRQVFTRTVDLGDLSLGDAQAVTHSTVGAWEPSVFADPLGRYVLAYIDFATGNGDPMLATSADGVQWTTPRAIASTPTTSHQPRAAWVNDGNVFVVWTEETSVGTRLRFTRVPCDTRCF